MLEPESTETNSSEPFKTARPEKGSTQLLTGSCGRGTEHENLPVLNGENEEWEVLSLDGDGGGFEDAGEVAFGGGEECRGGVEMGIGGGEGLKGEMEGGGEEFEGGGEGVGSGRDVEMGSGGQEALKGEMEDGRDVELGDGGGGAEGGGGVEIDSGREKGLKGELDGGGEVELGDSRGGEELGNGVELAAEVEKIEPQSTTIETVEEKKDTTEQDKVREPVQSGCVIDCEGNENKNGTGGGDQGEDHRKDESGTIVNGVKGGGCKQGREKEDTGPR